MRSASAETTAASEAGNWKLAKDLMPCFVELADGIENAMKREFGDGLQSLEVLTALYTRAARHV